MKRALPLLLCVPAIARAHAPDTVGEDGSTLFVSAALFLSLMLYAAGYLKLWPHVRARRQLTWRAIAFLAGWGALALALLSPLDSRATGSFAYHMIQHEVLMLVAAPLLVAGRALPTFLWSLPHDARVRTGLLTRSRHLRRFWNGLTSPSSGWVLHAAALWLWHLPVLFNAAVTNSVVHDWQHATFLLTALIFWHALLRHGSQGARGMALVYLFTTTIHTGVLGALLTFAPRPLYATLDAGLRAAGDLTALEDQQLGGLIMWVPGAIVYVAIALLLASRWLREMEFNSEVSRRR